MFVIRCDPPTAMFISFSEHDRGTGVSHRIVTFCYIRIYDGC